MFKKYVLIILNLFLQIPSGKLLHKILAHSELIYDLDWSHNDKYFLSASGDYSVK